MMKAIHRLSLLSTAWHLTGIYLTAMRAGQVRKALISVNQNQVPGGSWLHNWFTLDAFTGFATETLFTMMSFRLLILQPSYVSYKIDTVSKSK